MKKGLLLTILSFFLINVIMAQLNTGSNHCDGCPVEFNGYAKSDQGDPLQLKIYPNPATSYIELTNSSTVDQILIYNVVGKKMKSFIVKDDGKYNVSDLPHGMYLVQLIGTNNKIIKTQRLSKR